MSIPSSNIFINKTFTAVETNPSIPYDFKVTDSSHFRAVYVDAAGSKTLLEDTTNYVVTGVGNKNGGAFNYIGTTAIGDRIIVDLNNIPATQGTTFDYATLFQSNAIEVAFDYITNLFKRLLGVTNRSFQLPQEDQGASVEVPAKLSRKNTVMGFNNEGDFTTFDSSSLSAGVGITGASKQFNVGVGATVNVGEFTMVNSDTSVRLKLSASVGGEGSIRVREYYITDLTDEVALVVSSVDNFKTGKNGGKDVTFVATPSASGVTIDVVGNAGWSGDELVDIKYTIETFINQSDGNFNFA